MKANSTERQAWIMNWLKESYNLSADSVNQSFHEAYHEKFPQFSFQPKCWGAQPVRQAMIDLSAMYNDGLIQRDIIPLGGNWQPGFPKWVWSYTLKCLDKI